MSEAERFCDEKATIIVPGIALNYDGNMLESVGIGGEMFRRETPLSAENTRLRAENAKLRELCANLWPVAKSGVCIERCKLYDECIPNYDENGCILKRQLRELGILTCTNCEKREAHGYPPKGIEKTAFTVSLWCSETGESTDPYDSCDKHQIGEPRIVRDDVDGW